MRKNRGKRWTAVFCAAAMILASFAQGCGSGTGAESGAGSGTKAAAETKEDLTAKMKEFSVPDGTAFIHLDQAWVAEDTGIDSFLTAGSSDGSEAVILMQFPKNSAYAMGSMDNMKAVVEENYSVADDTDVEAPDVPGMTSLTAFTGTMTADGQKAAIYVVYGETDYAHYTIMYAAEKITDEIMDSMAASCSTFREEAPEVVDNTTVELTDTVRWFNASYAVLTEINGWDYNRFAGLPANDDSMELEKTSLEEWWGVTDRASADETLDWILTEGHRAGFAENMKYLEECGLGAEAEDDRTAFILANFDMTEEEAQSTVNSYGMYEEFGEDAITGWDYCRAMNLMSFYYLAGYYTEQEALDKSLEIAQTMQPLFESWDDLMDSYLRGYEYWAEESSDQRRDVYEELKTRSDNPYQVDYMTPLEKTW